VAGAKKGQPLKLYDFSEVFGPEPEQDYIPLASQRNNFRFSRG